MSRESFVSRQGSKLFLNGKPFRFAGPNIYWLGLDENVGGVDWPSEFRVINALDTARVMGATVVRSHTLGASHGHPKSLQPQRGVYNEEAFRHVDFAIYEAGKRNVKLIIPLTCNWKYYHGGMMTFVSWRGLDDPRLFYTDRQIMEDFKAWMAQLLNRRNTYSGVVYKHDPTVMAWELGNELNDAPAAWVAEMAAYLKSLDPVHLVAHGKQFQVDEDKLTIPELDILDVHYYPCDASKLRADAEKVARAGKVYMAGEFGWPQGDLFAFLAEAERNEAVSGTLFWSLFGHDDECGYVEHYDGFSLHYPGSGVNAEIYERVMRLREHAYAMSGTTVPGHPIPASPHVEVTAEAIRIRGVVGAVSYTVEKSTVGAEGPWVTLFDRRAADHDMPWVDPTRAHSAEAWYRVKAHNADGDEGGYSPVVFSPPYQP